MKLVDRFIRFFTAGITRHKKPAALLQDIFLLLYMSSQCNKETSFLYIFGCYYAPISLMLSNQQAPKAKKKSLHLTSRVGGKLATCLNLIRNIWEIICVRANVTKSAYNITKLIKMSQPLGTHTQ